MRRSLVVAGALAALLATATPAAAQSLPQAGCDPLDPAVCLQPWPNDFFTVADPSTDTGRRLDLNPLGMPRNIAGNPIRPDEWNRSDIDITTRMSHIQTGGGSNSILLNASTVHDDGAIDILTGSAGVDWYFSNLDTGVKDPITEKINQDFVQELI